MIDSSPEQHSFQRSSASSTRLPIALIIIPLCFLIPVDFSLYIGSLRLNAYRIGFIVFLPSIVHALLMSGRVQLRLFDWVILAYASWLMITLIHHLGFAEGIESGGVIALETVAAYFVARTFLTDYDTIVRFIRYLIVLATIVAIILIIEMIAGQNLVNQISTSILGTAAARGEIGRFGLVRALGPFTHPIHAGIMAGGLFAFHWALCRSQMRRWLQAAVLGVGVFGSISSGPFLMLLSQMALLLYQNISKRLSMPRPWYVLTLAAIAFMAFLQIASNRGAVLFLVQNLAFNAWNGFYRILQWNFAGAEVMRNPLWGIGFGEWARPRWMMMNTSIDSFWLATSLRYGLPSTFLLIVAIVLIWRAVIPAHKQRVNANLRSLSLSWFFVMATWIFVGITVHFWTQTYVFFFLVLGMGAAIAEIHRKPSIQGP
ncbi:MAG: hypothetical protein COA62_08095 [Rhodobiaceae bacterium]|nr:MAG: hypothetical protein COA62_08095 [Rhodobiaceae bacterium]